MLIEKVSMQQKDDMLAEMADASQPDFTGTFWALGELCAVCGKAPDDSLKRIPRCTQCRLVAYCCVDHQTHAWKRMGHKKSCTAPLPTPSSVGLADKLQVMDILKEFGQGHAGLAHCCLLRLYVLMRETRDVSTGDIADSFYDTILAAGGMRTLINVLAAQHEYYAVYHIMSCLLPYLMLGRLPSPAPNPVRCNMAVADGIGDALRAVLEGKHGMHKGGFFLIQMIAGYQTDDSTAAARRSALASAGVIEQLCLLLNRTSEGGRTCSQILEDNPELDIPRHKHKDFRESQHAIQRQVIAALVYLHFGADDEAKARRLLTKTQGSPVGKAHDFISDCIMDSEADELGSGPQLKQLKLWWIRMSVLLMIDTACHPDGKLCTLTDESILRAMSKIADEQMDEQDGPHGRGGFAS